MRALSYCFGASLLTVWSSLACAETLTLTPSAALTELQQAQLQRSIVAPELRCRNEGGHSSVSVDLVIPPGSFVSTGVQTWDVVAFFLTRSGVPAESVRSGMVVREAAAAEVYRSTVDVVVTCTSSDSANR